MKNPLISVLMPVKELSEYLPEAVSSILRQTHSNLELLIIGQDNIDEILQALTHDERIKGISRTNPGIVGALNTGLQHSSGEYIARMDSDDIATPDRLGTQLDMAHSIAVESGHHPLLGTQVEFFSNSNSIGQGNRRYELWLNSVCADTEIRNSCFIESPLPHPTFFAHKSVWETIGAYRDLPWPEDYDYILRAWLNNTPMGKPRKVLLHWREHANRLTHLDDRYSKQAFIDAKAWALTQTSSALALNKARGIWICGTGRNARMWHDALLRQNANVLGFVDLGHEKQKKQKRHLPIIDYQQLETVWSDELVITAITDSYAREKLVALFTSWEKSYNEDFVLGG